jgi:hypothetical protein
MYFPTFSFKINSITATAKIIKYIPSSLYDLVTKILLPKDRPTISRKNQANKTRFESTVILLKESIIAS